MKVIFIVLLSLSAQNVLSAANLRPFETDYCTNYPEGTKKKPDLWKHCCLMHDMFFWSGGTLKDRSNADLDLRSCIEATGAIKQSRIMYAAVRMGSYSPLKYPKKKWGNGWDNRTENASLTKEEIKYIEAELASGYDYINPTIKEYFLYKLNSRSE